MTVKISEEELKRRVASLEANTKIAGPDDPIYQSGLHFSTVKFMKTTKNTAKSTGGEMQGQPQDSLNQPQDSLSRILLDRFNKQMEEALPASNPEDEELLKFPCSTNEDDDDFIYNADDE